MTTYPTNTENISGYIGNVENAFFNGSLSAGSGSLGDYPLTAFASAVNTSAGQTTVTSGNLSWTFNLLDLSSTSSPELQASLTQNYLDSPIVSVPSTALINLVLYLQSSYPGLEFMNGGNTTTPLIGINIDSSDSSPLQISLGTLGLSVGQIQQWYNNNPFSAAEWSSSSFWQDTTGSPSNKQIGELYDVLSYINSPSPNFSNGYGAPTTFNSFLSLLSNLQIPTQYNSAGGAATTEAGITYTALTPSFSTSSVATSGTALLQTLFASYVQNYGSLIPGLLQKVGTSATGSVITNIDSPQAFAAGWYEYLQEGYPISTSGSLPIYYTDATSTSAGTFNVNSGSSVSIPSSDSIVQFLSSSASIPSISTFVSTFVSDLQTDYNNQTQFTQDSTGITTPSGTTNESLLDSNFETFMNYIVNQGGASTISSYDTFMSQWDSFVGPIAILNASGTETNSQNLLTYLDIYNVFYPSGNPQHDNFMLHLTSFVNGFVGATGSGFFNPSVMVDQWFSNLVNKVYSSHVVTPPNSLDAGNYEGVRVLNVLYKGLASLVENVQALTVSQANRLDFYSTQQQLYTDLLKKIPAFVENPSYNSTNAEKQQDGQVANTAQIVSSSPVDGNSSISSDQRSDLNTLSSQYTTNVQSFRTEASSQGNAFQAVFSQSNSSVNTDISVATQILQVVNTIANAIFAQQQQNFDQNSTY